MPDEADEAIEARGLEGRYRALLGDVAGASLAFARLRERAGRDARAVAWLDEAATFGRETLEMVRAFNRIGDPLVRRRLYDLARALAAMEWRAPEDAPAGGDLDPAGSDT